MNISAILIVNKARPHRYVKLIIFNEIRVNNLYHVDPNSYSIFYLCNLVTCLLTDSQISILEYKLIIFHAESKMCKGYKTFCSVQSQIKSESRLANSKFYMQI